MNVQTLDAAPTRPDLVSLYWEMTRPRVLFLVLFTGLPVLAMAGWPSWSTGLGALAGAALAGASASVLNAWVERDRDARMARTRGRPLPAEALAPGHALAYGLSLALASAVTLQIVGGPLACLVGLGSVLFYVVVYTWWLKPRTPQNIVIGGAAGATTPLICDAAISGSIGAASLSLALIIFLWTPPHFWAVALYRKREYAAAGLPMMPLVVGDEGTRWRMLGYSVLLIPGSLLPALTGSLGQLYVACAMGLGAWFLARANRCLRIGSNVEDRRFFMASNLYLLLLFAAMAVDALFFGAING